MNKRYGGYTIDCANGFGIQPLPSAETSARMAMANFDASSDPLANADRVIINGWDESMAFKIDRLGGVANSGVWPTH